ncbi:hypothetical protein HJG53_16965 [Sphingomonas sp. ID1715]|uniref:AbrB/MazE/SpoVT family DNA-binding domain-containing protein n=1 Tax=Sphingomonas sp. ID1715 TaxID=1656898 RepID=UPI001489C152|nr:hypothetical protein [Sphingomonas sp. ID1715]NNM78581.1 hypothetical protein [Sphingomonas sp. ID1715]
MEPLARTALRRMGNSTGMIVPKAILAAMGAREGEPLDVSVENGRLVAARPGELVEEVTISTKEEAELQALAAELKAATSRMSARLEEASAAVRAALDPARETELRVRFEKEFAGSGEGLFEALTR